MALIVENGSVVAGADALISRADATTYHTSRGNAAWSDLSDDDKDTAIRRATDYLGETYRMRLAGYRFSDDQTLDWPRAGVPRQDIGGSYPADAVPAEVVRACAELALRAASGPLTPDQAQAIKSVAAGSVKIDYADYSKTTKSYPAIDRLMAPFLTGSSASVRLIRS